MSCPGSRRGHAWRQAERAINHTLRFCTSCGAVGSIDTQGATRLVWEPSPPDSVDNRPAPTNRPKKMYATLLGSGVSAKDDGSHSPIEAGQLVLVEVPHNCVVFTSSPITAREAARSWFMAGVHTIGKTEDVWETEFEQLWNQNGIGGPE